MAVLQFAVRLLSPVTHSALMSLYTCTLWDLPSFDFAVMAIYENGSDCFTRSVGCSHTRQTPRNYVRTRRDTHLDGAEEVHGEVHRAGGHHECALRGRELVIHISLSSHELAPRHRETRTVRLFCTDFWKLVFGTAGAPRKLYVVPSTLTKPAHPRILRPEQYQCVCCQCNRDRTHGARHDNSRIAQTERRMVDVCEGRRTMADMLQESIEQYRDMYNRTQHEFNRILDVRILENKLCSD